MRTAAVIAILALSMTGCVHRSLTVKTEPPGAKVYINDELKGTSPLTYDFLWYGWYRVTLRKKGYQRLDDHRKIQAPAYLWMPLDLAMQLMPFPVRDDRTWEYALTPSGTLPAPRPPTTFPSPEKEGTPDATSDDADDTR
jgi:hypothetical protein